MNLEEHLDDPDPTSQTVHLHLRVHQVDLLQIDRLDLAGQVEVEVHVLEKMNNVMIAELN